MHAPRTTAALIGAVLVLGVPATAHGAAPVTGGPAPATHPVQPAGVPSLAVVASVPSTVAEGEAGLTEVDLLAPAGAATQRQLPGAAAQRSQQAQQSPSAEEPDAGTTVLEREIRTDGATVVGLAWEPAGGTSPAASIRFGRGGSWEPWADVEMEDAGDPEAGAQPLAAQMSESMVAAGADRVQVRITGLDEAPLTDASIVLVDGGADVALGGHGTSAGTVTLAGPVRAASVSPTVLGRARWGADESVARAGCERPSYASSLDRFVVHHTAGTNSYSAADSAGIIRGIQNYHRVGRGWCDIGYNVVVDKYGQVFEGRAGGLGEVVVGVHASGHNTGTVGVSVLGDYTQVAPTAAAITALVNVIGWKSYLHGIDPATSAAKDGQVLRRVIGHREVQATACPGRLQDHLGDIAQRARTVMLGYQPAFEQVTSRDGMLVTGPAAVSAVVPVPASWTVTFRDAAGTVVGTRTGTATRRSTITASFPTAADGSVGPGTYSARLEAVSTNGKAFSASASVRVSQPAGFVAAEHTGAVRFASSTSAGDQATLRVADLGLPAGGVSALVTQVCSPGSASVRLAASSSGGSGVHVRTETSTDGCGWALVGVGVEESVRVSRDAGSQAVTVDVLGYLRAPAPGVPYWDVPASLAFVPDIRWLAEQGITTGNADGSFRPSERVSRQAMAAFLHRAAGAPSFTPPRTPSFTDVPTSHPFFTEIEWLAASGIATGTDLGGGRAAFKPSDGVSRQAMAAFLYRANDARPVTGGTSFPDVPASSPFAAEIRWLATTEVTTGYADGTFRPSSRISRQAMAAFLHRADGLR